VATGSQSLTVSYWTHTSGQRLLLPAPDITKIPQGGKAGTQTAAFLPRVKNFKKYRKRKDAETPGKCSPNQPGCPLEWEWACARISLGQIVSARP
jgi:hypothetical protein